MQKKVLVKWLRLGKYIEDGYAYPRNIGDEDIMDSTTAKSKQICGLVQILGNVDDVLRERTLSSGATNEILDGREE